MASEGKNNTWYWVVGTIVVLGVIYFIFKEKIDRYLGIAKDLALNQTNYSCASTFYVKTEDGKTQNVWTSDEGTSIAPNVKYYKQDVTLTENGVTNSGSPVAISKEAFTSFCKYKYNPPYEWYTAKAPENTGHGRTFAACDKFNSECKGVSAQSWINNRCDVLWNSCIGTWGRTK